MDSSTLTQILEESLQEFSSARIKVRHCLPAFEKACAYLIEEIGTSTRADAETHFDQLLQLQSVLSKAVFVHEIEIGGKLMIIVRKFERLHDPYMREYWFKRFQAGQRWPS